MGQEFARDGALKNAKAGLVTLAARFRISRLHLKQATSVHVFLKSYAGLGTPAPNFDWLLFHPSKLPNQNWATVFKRAGHHADDGHKCKVIRGMKHAENVWKPFNHLPDFKVKQNVYLPAAIAAIDSGCKQPMKWAKYLDFVRGLVILSLGKRFSCG